VRFMFSVVSNFKSSTMIKKKNRFATGIEFREPNYLISNKCTAVAEKGLF
jgi:hypothetical protein